MNSILYRALSFDTKAKLDGTITFFESKEILVGRVKHLQVISFPIMDPNTVIKLMNLFTNVRDVSFYDAIHIASPDWNKNSLTNCISVWTHLASFTVTPAMFYTTPLFISSNIYMHLIYLDVQIMDEPAGRQSTLELRNKSKLLVSHIHQAPNLQTLILRSVFLRLYDLEIIHAAVPKLKRFDLLCANLFGEQAVHPVNATNLLLFSLKIANGRCALTNTSMNTKCRCFEYFGEKCKSSQDYGVLLFPKHNNENSNKLKKKTRPIEGAKFYSYGYLKWKERGLLDIPFCLTLIDEKDLNTIDGKTSSCFGFV